MTISGAEAEFYAGLALGFYLAMHSFFRLLTWKPEDRKARSRKHALYILIIPIFDAGRFFGSLFMSFFTRDQATAAPITADFPALLLSMLIYILIAAVVYLLSQGIYWLYDLAKPDSDSAQDQ
jgi:hypothetical protein